MLGGRFRSFERRWICERERKEVQSSSSTDERGRKNEPDVEMCSRDVLSFKILVESYSRSQRSVILRYLVSWKTDRQTNVGRGRATKRTRLLTPSIPSGATEVSNGEPHPKPLLQISGLIPDRFPYERLRKGEEESQDASCQRLRCGRDSEAGRDGGNNERNSRAIGPKSRYRVDGKRWDETLSFD